MQIYSFYDLTCFLHFLNIGFGLRSSSVNFTSLGLNSSPGSDSVAQSRRLTCSSCFSRSVFELQDVSFVVRIVYLGLSDRYWSDTSPKNNRSGFTYEMKCSACFKI